MNTAAGKTDPDALAPAQRLGELVSVVALLLLFGFFALHQFRHTGFFTAGFGSLEMLALYGPIIVAIAAPLVRAASGRRDPARPLEAAANLALAFGSLWLLIVFPLNYAHLADVLPGIIRPLLAWITDNIARIVLLLQVVIGPISAALNTWRYVSAPRRASAHAG